MVGLCRLETTCYTQLGLFCSTSLLSAMLQGHSGPSAATPGLAPHTHAHRQANPHSAHPSTPHYLVEQEVAEELEQVSVARLRPLRVAAQLGPLADVVELEQQAQQAAVVRLALHLPQKRVAAVGGTGGSRAGEA